jgi:voltage-gated potassium channel
MYIFGHQQYILKNKSLRERLYEIIFESDSGFGKAFDFLLMGLIVLSIAVVVLESVHSIRVPYLKLFHTLEWIFTILFTLEYLLRIFAARSRLGYIFSFYGFIDFLAIVPSYLSIFFPSAQFFLDIMVLRLLRVFRIFKLNRYMKESRFLTRALFASRIKISLFLSSVFIIVVIIGATMYFVEGHINEGFSNIPLSMYWAVVTLTTVGYGDVIPVTAIGKIFAGMLMVLGYAIIAVPTGIVSAEMRSIRSSDFDDRVCSNCGLSVHDDDAVFCKHCGSAI